MIRMLPLAAMALLVAACASDGPSRGGGAGGQRLAGGSAPTVYIVPEALLFAEFDADRDLRITFDELVAGADTTWTAIARGEDRTGYVEVQDWITSRLGAATFPVTVIAFDQNYDSVVTAEEFKTELRRRFLLRDDDLDRVLTRSEFVEEATQRREQQARPPAPSGGPPQRRR
jgi:hypothetical protein